MDTSSDSSSSCPPKSDDLNTATEVTASEATATEVTSTEVSALSQLKNLAQTPGNLGLSQLKTTELFDMHQTLTQMFSAVVEEMKSRQPNV